jgi:hypothetical protein
LPGSSGLARFTSQALKTDEALLVCMAYVDLNPVRAEITDRPETSSYTSIRERLQSEFDFQQAIDDQTECGDLLDFKTPLKPLLPFESRLINESQTGILFNFEEYLGLVDWTGRIVRSDKCGHIDNTLPPILDRLQITADQWRINATQFETIHPKRFNRLVPKINTG